MVQRNFPNLFEYDKCHQRVQNKHFLESGIRQSIKGQDRTFVSQNLQNSKLSCGFGRLIMIKALGRSCSSERF